MRLLKAIFALTLSVIISPAFAQTDAKLAANKAQEAFALEDKGDIDGAVKLLKESEKLDPGNSTYPYEIGFAFYMNKEYLKASQILKLIIDNKDATFRFYQLLGNCYDYLNQTNQAKLVYQEGLKKFPASGELYHELGVLEVGQKNYDDAISYYEKGVSVDPSFPSNYFRLANIFFATNEQVWGMIYGEMFMNLERNTERTKQMSKSLFDVYKSQIEFKGDSGASVSFSKMNTITISNISDLKKFKLPFGIGAYEPTMMLAVIGENKIDLNSLDRIRTRFIKAYYEKDLSTKYPNVLFDFQHKINKLGYMEAYNHWILMKGDPDAFDAWYNMNKDKWETFTKWFTDNPIKLDTKHYFVRSQYN